MNEARDVLRLTIGPLHYEFHAHDAWGVDALQRLRANVVVLDFLGAADRVLHLADLGMTSDEHNDVNRDWLPERYAALLPEDAPRQGWRLTGDETGHLTFRHDATWHGLCIFGAIPADSQGPFQLPWPPLLEDIVAREGAILHGGLIAQCEQAYIITAPSGGGKTTTISRLPADWRVLADDACLVWPGREGKFLASPLPTWSVVLGRGEPLPAVGRWQIGGVILVAGILFLKKGKQDQVKLLQPLKALPLLYQAISEHPRVVTNRESHRARLFDVARALAGATATWQLDAALDGQFWEQFRPLASQRVSRAGGRIAIY